MKDFGIKQHALFITQRGKNSPVLFGKTSGDKDLLLSVIPEMLVLDESWKFGAHI